MPTEKELNKNEIIIENMKRGFDGLESKTYQDYNVSTGAMGFYQYVPSQWLDSMRAFAKKNDFLMSPNDIPTEEQWAKDRKNIKTIEQGKQYFSKILENKAFQDEFFKHDMTDLKKLDQAKELYNKYADSTGYSIEAFVGAVHFLGSGGAKTILEKAKKDPTVLDKPTDLNNKKSLNEYNAVLTNNIEGKGGFTNRPAKFDDKGVASSEPNAQVKAFQERHKKIISANLNEETRTQALNNLYNEVGKAGYQREFTQYLQTEAENINQQFNDFKEGKTDGGRLLKALTNSQNVLTTFKDGSYRITLTGDERDKEYLSLLNDLKEKGIVARKDSYSTSNPVYEVGSGLGEAFSGIGSAIGSAWNFGTDIWAKGMGTMNSVPRDKKEKDKTAKNQVYYIKGDSASKLYNIINNEAKTFTNGESVLFDENGKLVDKDVYKETFKNLKPNTSFYEVDWNNQAQREVPVTIPDKDQSAKTSDQASTGTTTKTTEVDPAKIKRMNEEADSHFSRFVEPQELDIPDTWKYDPKNYKKELPLEALAYGAMGLMGMGDAKTPLPERTDEISQAILSYTNNLKRMSEMGLKPEEEAKLKDDLAGAYQESLDQLVRASNGNRNVVLGNMGGLNKNRLDAIGNMAMMDVVKKDAAYEKYGKALEYVQNFNTQKAIDNHKIKLDAAKEKRAAGAALASTGFSSMLAELQHQKDNGPGSMNHQYFKTMMVKLTGVDSDIEDDGTGKIPFTASYNKAKAIEAQQAIAIKTQEYNEEKAIVENWKGKSQEEQNKYDNYAQYVDRTRNPEQYAVKPSPILRDHMVQGGSVPTSRINPMMTNAPLLGVQIPEERPIVPEEAYANLYNNL